MQPRLIEEYLARQPHGRLLRFLAAASRGLSTEYLGANERLALEDLSTAGLVSLSDDMARLSRAAGKGVRSSLAGRKEGEGDGFLSERLRFIRELTRVIAASTSISDLFRESFRALHGAIEFDLAAIVILGENLDVYLSRRTGLEDPLSERFVSEVKKEMEALLSVSFGETDLLVRANFPDLPQAPTLPDIYRHRSSVLIQQGSPTAGMLTLFSSKPLPADAAALLDVVASQISIGVRTIRTAERIQNLADTDDLTGIWNKRWLRRQLPNEIERARVYNLPLSVAMFDIDDFKRINDEHGHVFGDVLLSELCGTIREALRPPDMMARFGGDEFAVLLPHSDLIGARAVSERILQRTRALRLLADDGVTEVSCTVSVGIGVYEQAMTADDLIQRADERLYESKRSGKNRVTW